MSQLMGNWNFPTQVKFGTGRVNELPDLCVELGIKKPLLVTDQGLADLPMTTKLVAQCKKAGLGIQVFKDVKPNPTGDNVMDGLQAYLNGGHDGVIAFGGGSSLDAGKAVALMVGQTHKLFEFEDVGDNWTRVNAQTVAPIIAIPTTAGTGSEVGRASVIHDVSANVKKIIFHPTMLPEVVIADPELTVGLNVKMTSATGMDALSHNLEAFCAPGYHPMADGIAVEAIRLIQDNLVVAVENGNDMDARSHMLAASLMGATAFQKGLGGMHALAHPLGAIYDAHHGLLNAILMPYVLTHNQAKIEERICRLTQYMGLSDPSFSGFLTWVIDLRARIGIPHSLSEIGLDLAGNDEKMNLIASMAIVDPSNGGNPITMTEADYKQILMKACQ